jgi:heme/copper-type cytochrome/quinol oxidase subunit 3
VCVGLIALLILMGLAVAGDFNQGRIEAVKSIGLYWHFVDAVWLVVFFVIYLRLLI